jgi:hypothetical protein
MRLSMCFILRIFSAIVGPVKYWIDSQEIPRIACTGDPVAALAPPRAKHLALCAVVLYDERHNEANRP